MGTQAVGEPSNSRCNKSLGKKKNIFLFLKNICSYCEVRLLIALICNHAVGSLLYIIVIQTGLLRHAFFNNDNSRASYPLLKSITVKYNLFQVKERIRNIP